MIRRVIIIVMALLVTIPAVADDFQYHGSFLWNGVRAIVGQEQFLFCAFHEGIGSVDLNRDYNKKKLYSTLEMAETPYRLYLFGELLVAEDMTGEFSLIDVSDPFNMILRGSFRPASEIVDMCRLDNFLYAAMQYDGLFRYDISNPNDIIFDDSSMVGIHVTRLVVSDSLLLALDDYNGILIYNPQPSDIGLPIGELLLPHQGLSLAISGDTVFSGISPNGVMLGLISDVKNPTYLELSESYIRADKIDPVSQGLVLSNGLNGFELIYGQGDSLIDQIFPIERIWGKSLILDYQGGSHIMFAHRLQGFVGYNVENPEVIELEYPIISYASPGPITQLSFIKSRLHSIGTRNWYEIFDLSDPDNPFRSGKIINPPYRPAGMCSKGDTLFLADYALNAIFPALDRGEGDPTVFFPFFIINDSINRPHIVPGYFPNGDLIYYYDDFGLRGSFRNDTLVNPNLFSWKFAVGVTSAIFNDTIVYVNNDKGIMSILATNDEFQINFVGDLSLPGKGKAMVRVDSLLYVGANILLTYSIANDIAPVRLYENTEATSINEMIQVDSWLIVAARNGIFIYDISSGQPQLMFSGGTDAKHVAYHDNLIAASDGYSVKIYTLLALDTDEENHSLPDLMALPNLTGFPNPFNPEIKLRLTNFRSQATPVIIDIYDVLGRHVRKLEVRTDNSGIGEISWDGRDFDNRARASGIYFFRASRGTERAVYKAILLK